ncbi:MAG: UDP-N-acetylmuramate dehydrogenase [Acidimicrobiales bacterium]
MTSDPAVAVEALAQTLGGRALRDAPLGVRTTYRVGGRASLLVEVDGERDLTLLHRALCLVDAEIPVLVLGKGSNLLVADAGFVGLVVVLGPGFTWVEMDGAVVRAGGATGFPVAARRSAAAGLHGLEWAVGVPGSVGGAVCMNAGGHGADTASVLTRYHLFGLASGQGIDRMGADLGAGYRHSTVGGGDVVLWAQFTLTPGDAGAAQTRLSDIVAWRRQHQPGGSNAGSVFTNPVDTAAGALVESAGLKGMRMGTAEVSSKHANFIQADEGGSADDVRRLMDHVREVVAKRTGVELVPEVRMVGFADTPSPTVRAHPAAPAPATPSSSSRGLE